jgi:transcriptional regulator with PAS, ATPase and Fis domain
MLELYAFARKVAKSSLNVLVTGETGAGKELLAQAIHESSWRGQRPLVTLNCAALPENLVESELFGYERGAFSGAAAAKPGLFEVADGSTIFLDEIGELPLQVQAKLLRVLEMREVQRLGAVRPTRVDVRVVAATNRHLSELVAAGSFRADLFYRLNGLTLSIPALRERPDDIEALALHFAAQASGHSVRLTPAARELLRTHAWPGNVRELKSVLERAMLVCHKEELDAADLDLESTNTLPKIPVALPLPGKPDTPPRDSEDKEPFTAEEVPTNLVRAELERRERRHIKEALERTGGNQSEAAVLLGISRRTLMNRMDRYGMNRPRKGGRRGEDG